MASTNVEPLSEIDPDVCCVRPFCDRPAQLSVELDATTDGTPVAELWCCLCFAGWDVSLWASGT